MKTSLALAALVLVASPAYAIKVDNLDSRDHVVVFDSAGSQMKETVPAGRSTWFPDEEGTISMLDPEVRQPSKGRIHDDNGLLHGVAGIRTEGIPVSSKDEVAIWQGGEMGIQRRLIRNDW